MIAASSHSGSGTGLGAARGISTTASEAGLSPLLFCALRVMLTPSLLVSPVMVTGLAASAGLSGT
jgi:hypothetical protein